MLCDIFLYKFWHLNLGTKAANKGEAAVTRRDKCSPLQPLGRSCSQSCSRLGLLTLVFSFVKQNIQPGSIWKQSSDGKCQHLGFGLLLVCAFLPRPIGKGGSRSSFMENGPSSESLPQREEWKEEEEPPSQRSCSGQGLQGESLLGLCACTPTHETGPGNKSLDTSGHSGLQKQRSLPWRYIDLPLIHFS